MKRLQVILVIAAVVLAAAVVAKDVLIKSALSTSISLFTGARVEIDSFSFQVLKQSIRMKGFRMYNPPGFPQSEILIDIPSIGVDFDMASLLKKNIYLPYLELDIKEVVIIKNKDGKLNVNSLKFAEQKSPAKGKATAMPMRMDVVSLRMDRVVVKDFTAAAPPLVQVQEIGLNKTYKNISSAQQLTALIMSQALGHTALQGAAVYGAAALTGVAILPVGAAFMLAGKDSAQAAFEATPDAAYQAAAATIKAMGSLTAENKDQWILKGKVRGADIAIKIVQGKGKGVEVVVSARKYMIPKPGIAGGVLYEIAGRLK